MAHCLAVRFFRGLVPALLPALLFAVSAQAQTATVTVNRSSQIAVNGFGTATVVANDNNNSSFLSGGRNAAAVASAESILNTDAYYFGIPIMGWSFGNPEPTNGNYQLGQITAAINQVQTTMPNCVPVITLCTCPGWMKADGNDWNMDEAPTAAHYQDFANLCVQIANATYPTVKHFQVWNEFKGFWNNATNDWDVASYTTMYNLVYNGIKTAHPDVQVGGPYIPMEGSGTNQFLAPNLQNWYTANPITARNQGDINYWLSHAAGADYIVYDKGVTDFHDPNTYTEPQYMSLYTWIGSIGDQLWTMMANNASGALAHKQLPIWIAECYPRASTLQQGSAALAAWYQQMELHHGGAAFVWMPEDNTTPSWNYSLFTNTTNAGGGAADPMAGVFQQFRQNFPPGTALYSTTSSDGNILALASASKTMLINISSGSYTVTAEGGSQSVPGYGVVVVNAAVPPPAPMNLAATAGNAQVSLTWTPSSGATSYNVKRSTVSGSGYVTVASVGSASYTNTGLTNGTTYYYVVTAVGVGGESGNSNQASATPYSYSGVATVISLNFVGGSTTNGTPAPMGASETAGVAAVSNWNNASGASGTLSSLVNNTGGASSASVTWSSANTWSIPITDVAGNNRMMKGFIDTSNTSTSSVQVSGLPSTFTAGGYDVYVYFDGDNGAVAKTGVYTIGSNVINGTDAANNTFSGTFTRANPNGNYVVFSNVTGSTFTLTATPGSTTSPYPRAPINGIQIVAHRVFSVDFTGGSTTHGNPSPMGPTEVAGVIPAASWNNASGASGSIASILDSNSIVTGISTTWSSNNTWSTGVTEMAGNNRMMKGYLDTTNTSSSTVQVSNIPSSIATAGYDVYVYVDGDGGTATKTAKYTIGSASINCTDPGVDFSGTFTLGNNGSGNYIRFASVTGSSFSLTAVPVSSSDPYPRAPINGIEIVAH